MCESVSLTWMLLLGACRQGEDFWREGMGCEAPEAHLLWYVVLPGAQYASSNDLSGKILKDDEPISTYNIEEKGFVVCMVNKVRAATHHSSQLN